MKKTLFTLAVVLSLSLMTVSSVLANGSILQDYYNTGDNSYTEIYDYYWRTQTFTTGGDYDVTSVKLKLCRIGNPGEVTVSIRELDIYSAPTNGDLTSGTLDGDTITESTAGDWYEINLTPYSLTNGTEYAIVVRAVNGDGGNKLRWRGISPTTYTGGNYGTSGNSGDSWVMFGHVDLMFEVYGTEETGPGPEPEPEPEVGGDIYPINKLAILIPITALTIVLLAGTILFLRRRRTQS